MQKRGFTLIELMIVISIIGTLVAALYPNMANYLDRTHIFENKINAGDWIKMIEKYRIDNGGKIDSSPSQVGNPGEGYVIPYPGRQPDGEEYHTGLTTFFISTPEGRKILEGTKKQWGVVGLGGNDGMFLLKTSPQYSMTNGAGLWPGYSPTDTKKIWYSSWWVKYTGENTADNSNGIYYPAGPGYSEGYYRSIYISGSSLGKDLDRLCSPGFAAYQYIDSHPEWGMILCNYIFSE